MPFTAFFLQTYCPRYVHAWEAKHSRKESWRACKRRFSRVAVEASQIPAESVEYKDTPTDIAFIALCRIAYGNIAGWQSKRSWTSGHETFAGMVEVSRALMKVDNRSTSHIQLQFHQYLGTGNFKEESPTLYLIAFLQGRSSAEQREAVIAGFPAIPPWFRKLFPYSKWGAQLNAKITPAFFTWLVGPMETVEVEVNGQVQRSGVHIKRCRLAQKPPLRRFKSKFNQAHTRCNGCCPCPKRWCVAAFAVVIWRGGIHATQTCCGSHALCPAPKIAAGLEGIAAPFGAPAPPQSDTTSSSSFYGPCCVPTFHNSSSPAEQHSGAWSGSCAGTWLRAGVLQCASTCARHPPSPSSRSSWACRSP